MPLRLNNNYEILTPNGFKDFIGIQEITRSSTIIIHLKKTELKCAPDHLINTPLGYRTASEIKINDIIYVNNYNQEHVIDISYSNNFVFYDLVDVEDHEYLTNDIISHNCAFLGSSSTLISTSKLSALTYEEPVYLSQHLKYYQEVQSDRSYAITVDVAEGVGLDSSAFIVYDITDLPYKVVAVFNSNDTHPIVLPKYILDVAKYYNDAHILVETNGMGNQVIDILVNDLEYENIISTASVANKIVATFGFGRKSYYGVKTTKSVKRLGCATLKSMIENDKLIINDYGILHELTKFIFNGNSYEAEEGYHDDLVMCCVLFAWLTSQNYFKDLTNNDVVKNLFDENSKLIEDSLVPVGIRVTGTEPDREYLSIREFEDWHNK